MIVSRIFRHACSRCDLPKREVNKLAKLIEHIEHAGGVCVGIEFLAPHYFSALTLAIFAVSFFCIHVGASMWGEA